ncbi:CC/Se motif family (seleno)protein [Alkalihalophilus pseudofirmus]|uniref:CC/Se motif family (Seleno)protein n=1 Tax=Alkalihalophilus pseudofirmus TaxID=79885 RepID=A0AAJ2KW72_ALKPS|nr:CC/Se motif family (seleno)protein [Alkalihalophilus pseudofirmus]MDV2884170.1 CC/Se motif family (seleno)protein [Alkalihalophilus pseudofirmus]WEG18183.1 CC/Se motif family (seleno)protein [Alkalihalophilus pseudofirmus]
MKDSNIPITISKRAYDFIKKRGGTVSISLFHGNSSCCTGGITELILSYKAPFDRNKFQKIQHNEIELLIEPNLPLKDTGLKIDLSTFGWIKQLQATGLERF